MRERLKGVHKQNSGSTLVIVLTVVAFLSILAVVVSSAAVTNYKMKVINEKSQEAFYTSEDAVDEIYAALGRISMECFDAAYNDEVATMVKQTVVGGGTVSYTLSSITTNINLRKNYSYRLAMALNLVDPLKNPDKYMESSFVKMYNSETERKAFADLLNTFLEGGGKDGLKVVSVDSIEVIKTNTSIQDDDKKNVLFNYVLKFTNCRVEYINDRSYYSNITFDGELAMPDIYIDFAADRKNELTTFADYALVGNTGILINENNSLDLRGSAYAGKIEGLTLKDGSSLISGNNAIVSGGDINVINASLTANASDIWCTSILTSGSNGTVIKITGGSTFVKDDLQVEGDKADVSVGGNYYGYSYQRLNTAEGNHNNSSAIVVNGTNSVVDLSTLNTLVLGGRAYIDYKNGEKAYTTGESLSLKGTQEMYLVPSYLMGQTNPVVGDITGVKVDITADNFFGYGFLSVAEDGSAGITTKTVDVNGKPVTYYYLKFKDDEAAVSYVKALLDDTAYEAVKAGKSAKVISDYDKSRAYVKSVITSNLKDLQSSVVSTGEGCSVYTNGQMINASFSGGAASVGLGDTNLNYTVDAVESTDGFLMDSNDLSNRYSLMTRILMMPEFKDSAGKRNYIYTLGNSLVVGNQSIDISGYAENNVFANFISMEDFVELTSRQENIGGYINNSISGCPPNVVCCILNNNSAPVTIDNEGQFRDYDSGVIIASGDIYVKKNFKGTIMAGGNIYIDASVSITGDPGLVKDILAKDPALADILNANKPAASEGGDDKINGLSYRDFIEFINWRKSE